MTEAPGTTPHRRKNRCHVTPPSGGGGGYPIRLVAMTRVKAATRQAAATYVEQSFKAMATKPGFVALDDLELWAQVVEQGRRG